MVGVVGGRPDGNYYYYSTTNPVQQETEKLHVERREGWLGCQKGNSYVCDSVRERERERHGD